MIEGWQQALAPLQFRIYLAKQNAVSCVLLRLAGQGVVAILQALWTASWWHKARQDASAARLPWEKIAVDKRRLTRNAVLRDGLELTSAHCKTCQSTQGAFMISQALRVHIPLYA